MAKLFAERKIEQVFYNCDFSKIEKEIVQEEERFETSDEYDLRHLWPEEMRTASPIIACRMTYEKIKSAGKEPTEDELKQHLKTGALHNLHALDTEHYDAMPEVYASVTWIANAMKAEQIGRVMVARLVSNGHIAAHSDTGPYYDFYDRFHIVVGGRGCYFRVGRETVKMLPGEVWWFRNNDEHEVWNDTDTPRDHIVVDLKLRGEKNVHRTGGAISALH